MESRSFVSAEMAIIFVLYIFYLLMKKPKKPTEKPVPNAKAKQPIAAAATRTTPKPSSPVKKTQKKAPIVAPKAVAAIPKLTMSERVGMTAGSIWHYLAENGQTPVGTLLRELGEEEKIIQRSMGWLAQEDKIALDALGRVETLALKE
jgi:hypothetical protein